MKIDEIPQSKNEMLHLPVVILGKPVVNLGSSLGHLGSPWGHPGLMGLPEVKLGFVCFTLILFFFYPIILRFLKDNDIKLIRTSTSTVLGNCERMVLEYGKTISTYMLCSGTGTLYMLGLS